MKKRMEKTDQEWREKLSHLQYEVTRKGGTERAFSGRHHDSKHDGIYRCVCCGNELFNSADKYDSGTGWPSFTRPMTDEHVRLQPEESPLMQRVEVICEVCDAHLGHVFEDGPEPAGKRYCINSAALDFKEK